MNNNFTDFLKYTKSQKEVSLAVFNDDIELKNIKTILKDNDYQQIDNLPELIDCVTRPSKIFFLVENEFSKDLYDFVVQYSSGQIEIYDKSNLQSQIVTPVYNDVAIILVVKKEILQKAQTSGLNILENIGLTYQN